MSHKLQELVLAAETTLQFKVLQTVKDDRDRLRQLLLLFKQKTWTNYNASQGVDEMETTSFDRAEFRGALNRLGVYATDEVADALFDKYDWEQNGRLTLVQFMHRCTPRLVNSLPLAAPSEVRPRGYAPARRPRTPRSSVFAFPIKKIASAVRHKLAAISRSGATLSEPRARRELARMFEFYDPLLTRHVDRQSLARFFIELSINLGSAHIDSLVEQFPSVDEDGNTQVCVCVVTFYCGPRLTDSVIFFYGSSTMLHSSARFSPRRSIGQHHCSLHAHMQVVALVLWARLVPVASSRQTIRSIHSDHH